MKVTLKAHNLHWRGKERLRLAPVSFTVKQGEIFGLFGDVRSNNAKIINALAGTILPESGSLTVLGTSNIATVRQQIGSTFDILSFIPQYSIEKNLKILCMMKEIRPKEANKMLLLFDLWNHKNKTLSKCNNEQKKQMAIICALIGDPDIILLNRPLKFLSKESVAIVSKLLQKAATKGQTIFITDDLSAYISKICTQTLELEKQSTKSQIRKIKKTYLINKKAS